MTNGQAKLTYPLSRPLLEKLLAWLEDSLGGELLAAALFGSVARGQGTAQSDLDLLVVHRGPAPGMVDLFADLLRRLRQSEEYKALQAQGFLPDPYPVFFTREALAGHPWLLLDILDHGIILFDSDGVLAVELERLRKRLRDLGARKVELADGTWYWDLKPDWKPGDVIEI